LSIASELGMRPLIERVQALQEKVAAQPNPLPIYPDDLTGREVEVLRLIAAGNTARDIARKLVIAEGTVKRHLSNIYSKINANNRAEATRYTLQKDLLSPDELQSR
jgi:DNA-binding NarL/FixJ family response regulator